MIILFAGLLARPVSGQSPPCGVDTPWDCVGSTVHLEVRGGSRMTGLVEKVSVDGRSYALAGVEAGTPPPEERTIMLRLEGGQVTMIALDFVSAIQVAGTGLAQQNIPDGLLLFGVLVIISGVIAVLLIPRTKVVSLSDMPENLLSEEALRMLPEEPLPPLWGARRVSVGAVTASGLPVQEVDYLAIGGGMGSFAWVNCLRICGVAPEQIRVIGASPRPYTLYRRLCENSQIFDADRLRSDSGSTPDNLWGWPGYALREAWSVFKKGDLRAAVAVLWQVFGEPVLADPYTPRAGDVYRALEREAGRIGWDRMLCVGYVRCLRKTDDGRYVALYKVPTAEGDWQAQVLVATYVHMATGYSGLQRLPQLQAYRDPLDDGRFVHAYEAHEHIYRHLADYGGRVVLRGRGIVAARMIERLAEVRASNDRVHILHLMREPRAEIHQVGAARRAAHFHWVLQPFNWPKSAFGGVWQAALANSDAVEQGYILDSLGAVTTANRTAWRRLIEQGWREGWYQIYLGEIEQVVSEEDDLKVRVRDKSGRSSAVFTVDFMIDATGLNHHAEDNPLLRDLRQHYTLELNRYQRLQVNDDFEVRNMRNDGGRLYAAGVISFGGSYAPVDSFMGLQYAAQRSVDALTGSGAPGLRHLNGLYSARQWLRWAWGRTP